MKNGIFSRLATFLAVTLGLAFPSLASAANMVPLFDLTNYNYSHSSSNTVVDATTSTNALILIADKKTLANRVATAGIDYVSFAKAAFTFDYSAVTSVAPASGLGYTIDFVVNNVKTRLTGATGIYSYDLQKGDTFGWLLSNTGVTNSTAKLSITNFTSQVAAPEIDGAKLPLALLLVGLLFIASKFRAQKKGLAA